MVFTEPEVVVFLRVTVLVELAVGTLMEVDVVAAWFAPAVPCNGAICN